MKSSPMLDGLILNSHTRHLLEDYLANPAQAMLLTGPAGVGLGTIAQTLGHQLAGVSVVYLAPTLHNAQKTAIINADDIEYITGIVRDKRSDRLVIVMDDVDKTAPGVFERILKIVEEPVPNVYYLFTTHNPIAMPRTIISRSQVIDVRKPNANDCDKLLAGIDAAKRTQVKFLANRCPATMGRLINNPDDFAKAAQQMTSAKQFITGNTDFRLGLVAQFKDRADAIEFIGMLANLTEYIHKSGSIQYDTRLARNLQLISTIADRLNTNGNVKAQLLNLAVCYN